MSPKQQQRPLPSLLSLLLGSFFHLLHESMTRKEVFCVENCQSYFPSGIARFLKLKAWKASPCSLKFARDTETTKFLKVSS